MIVKPALAAVLASGLIVPETPKLVLPNPAIVKAENLDFSRHMLLGMPLTMGMLPGKAATPVSLINAGSIVTSATNSTSYSFSSYGIGNASATRRVIAVISGNSGSTGRALSSCTIGGVSADIHVQTTDNTSGALVIAVVSATVTTGTTATIAVNFNAGCISCAVYAVSVDNLISTTAHDTLADPAGVSLGGTIDWLADGIVVGGANCAVQASISWSGVTERSQVGVENLATSVAYNLTTSSVTNQSVTVSIGSGTTREAMCAASFR